jgi:hypothetical protein
MLPVLLPALAVAALLMGLINLSIPRASIRTWTAAVSKSPPLGQSLDARNPDNPRRDDLRPVGDLAFRFQKHLNGFALDVSWSTHARRLAILGSSGAGKSLVLRLIAGLVSTGRYEATIENVVPVAAGCEVSVRLGKTLLRIPAAPGEIAVTGSCRLEIDPGAIQVWPTEPFIDTLGSSSMI